VAQPAGGDECIEVAVGECFEVVVRAVTGIG